jgi:hypothetical protein
MRTLCGVFAWRYGWIPTRHNRRRISITEMEYREAFRARKWCLIFLLEPNVRWTPDLIDNDRTRIKRLRELLLERHSPNLFRSPDELGQLVAHAIHQWASQVSPKVRATQTTQTNGQPPFLDSVCPGAVPDVLNVEPFRLLFRPECRHEFPDNLSAHEFLQQNGLMAGGS